MPNRIIKESICTSDSLAALSWFEQALFIRLIVLADDFGAYDGRPAIIKGKGFPLDNVSEKQIAEGLKHIQQAGMITQYTVDGKPFLQLRTWGNHQQIRAKKSKFPRLPEVDNTCNQLISNDIGCNQTQSNVTVIQSNPIQSESESNSSYRRFTPPTVTEVIEYCSKAGISVDAQSFVDFYASKGWMVGKQKMKDWQAAARNWARRDAGKNKQASCAGYTPEPLNEGAIEWLNQLGKA